MARKSGPNKDNFEKTRALFLKLARDEFQTHGYANASTSRIVTASKMARGSLYYHFKDKQDVFRAVYVQIADEIAEELNGVLSQYNEAWDGFMALARRYFDICAEDGRGRLFIIESQSALPYDDRQLIISDTIRPVLSRVVGDLCKAGAFDGKNKEMMSLLIFGTLSECSRVIGGLPNRRLVETHFLSTFDWMMKKLKD